LERPQVGKLDAQGRKARRKLIKIQAKRDQRGGDGGPTQVKIGYLGMVFLPFLLPHVNIQVLESRQGGEKLRPDDPSPGYDLQSKATDSTTRNPIVQALASTKPYVTDVVAIAQVKNLGQGVV
jgi:hypothetical protein